MEKDNNDKIYNLMIILSILILAYGIYLIIDRKKEDVIYDNNHKAAMCKILQPMLDERINAFKTYGDMFDDLKEQYHSDINFITDMMKSYECVIKENLENVTEDKEDVNTIK